MAKIFPVANQVTWKHNFWQKCFVNCDVIGSLALHESITCDVIGSLARTLIVKVACTEAQQRMACGRLDHVNETRDDNKDTLL